MIKNSLTLIAALGAIAGLVVTSPAGAQERAVKIAGFGAKSGVVRVFGINSEAALKAALEQINNAGGVTLATAPRVRSPSNTTMIAAMPEEAFRSCDASPRRMRSLLSDRLARMSLNRCSAFCRRKVGDSSDSGLQFPIIADVAAKGGLARFRSGHSAMCRANSRCTSRCLPG